MGVLVECSTHTFVVFGDSNAEGRLTNAQSYSHATLVPRCFRQDDAWAVANDPTDVGTASGSPWPLLATAFMAALSRRIQFITVGTGSTKVTGWRKGQSNYTEMAAQITASGITTIKAFLCMLGTNDANDVYTEESYATQLRALAAEIVGDYPGTKVFFAKPGSTSGTYIAEVRAGTAAVWGEANTPTGPDLVGVANDGVHYKTDQAGQDIADAWWASLNSYFYGA